MPTSRNIHTGDYLRSKAYSEQGKKNFEEIDWSWLHSEKEQEKEQEPSVPEGKED